jgi:hypothetical protein
MKKMTVLIPLLSFLVLLAVAPAFASPQGNKLVINVTYNIINEEDRAVCSWYWALDYRIVHLQVWQLPDGTYLAEESSVGLFYVPKGAPQLIDWLTLQVRSGFGVLKSRDSWKVYGTLNPTTFADGSPLKTKGYLGTVDYEGTVADILKGLGAHGNPGYWDWASHYFSAGTVPIPIAGASVWTYRLLDDRSALARYAEATRPGRDYLTVVTGNIIT